MITIPYENHTRLLSLDDIDKVYEMLSEHQTIGKVPFIIDRKTFTEKIALALTQSEFRMIGYFEGDQLITFLFQSISQRIPTWHMTLLSTRSEHRWNYSQNGLDYCWANAMAYAEQKGINRMYWALPEKWAKTQERTILTSQVWPRYEIYIESLVLADDYPYWGEYRASFGEDRKPHNMIIKMGVLKNEFRRFDQTA